MASPSESDLPSTDSVSFGVWKDNHSLILRHKGSTFHNLTFRRPSNNPIITLEETIFALLRTDFILVDFHTKKTITYKSLMDELQKSNKILELLKVHSYLAFQKIGKSPRPLNEEDEWPPQDLNLDPSDFSTHSSKPPSEKVELHLLLDTFRNSLNMKVHDYSLGFNDPSFTVDGLHTFVTMPDSLSCSIFDNISDFNLIIAVSNLDSVYFLKISTISIT